MYDIKALYEAQSVEHAVALRLEHPQAQLIAGGSDVLVQIREGRRAGAELISIYGLDCLRGVRLEEDGTLRIGSLTSFSHITRDPLIQKYIPVLGEAVDQAGGPQLRAVGTIGGNVCNGITSADSASTLLALDARLRVKGPRGERDVPISQWYKGVGKVDLAPYELLVKIVIPRDNYEGYTGHYIKYAMRNAMDIATTGCSVNVVLSEDKKAVARARIAYGVAGPIPLRCACAEAAAQGRPLTEETVEAFAAAVLEDIHPRDSWRASKAFREHIAVELARRGLRESIKLAGGELA